MCCSNLMTTFSFWVFFKDMITYVPFERSLLEVLAKPDVMD